MFNLSVHQQKALDVQRNLAVTAGAGSGKTTVLVDRYLHILLQNPGLNVKEVLAITFTEKATAEMKQRIFNQIEEQFNKSKCRQGRLFEILNQLPEAQIFTIHSFCHQILIRYATEAEINPHFTILKDEDVAELLYQVFRDFLLSFQVDTHPQGSFIKLVFHEFSLKKLRDFFFFFYENRAALYPIIHHAHQLSVAEIQNYWKEIFIKYHTPLLRNFQQHKDFWDHLGKLVKIDIPPNVNGSEQQVRLRKFYEQFHQRVTDPFEQIQAMINIIRDLTKQDGTAYSRVPGGKAVWGEEGLESFKRLSEWAAPWSQNIMTYSDQTEEQYAALHIGLCALFFELLNRCEDQKTGLNALDFNDLQIYTRCLLQKNPLIREQLREQYKWILVDEFQDTDSLQADIIFSLSHDYLGHFDQNRLFIVGDPQQSIFGFRHADVAQFSEYIKEISRQGSQNLPLVIPGEKDPLPSLEIERQGIITLSQNFRSSPQLIQFFNQTFGSIFTADSEFDVPFHKLEPARAQDPSHISFVQLDLFIDQADEKNDFVARQAQRIVETIQQIVSNCDFQKLITEGTEFRLEKIDFGDIALLLRSRTQLQTFEQIFRDYHIPYQTFKGIGFFQKPEIQDLYYILRSIAHPEENFSLVVALRSDYIGLSDVCLYYLSETRGANYWEKLCNLRDYLFGQKEREEILLPDFHQFLKDENLSLKITPGEKQSIQFYINQCQEWHPLAWGGRFGRLLDEVIEKLRIRAVLCLQHDADQKLANVDKFLHYVAEYEQTTSTMLVEFLEMLRKQISGEIREGEAMILGAEENKVKIITYHSAKGMEFPVVFLPLLEDRFHYNQNIFFHRDHGFAFEFDLSKNKKFPRSFACKYLEDRDRKKIEAEEKRLFYVAATRARDYLFLLGTLPKTGKISYQNYLSWLLKAHNLDSPENLLENENPISPVERSFKLNLHHITTSEDTRFLIRPQPPAQEISPFQFTAEEMRYSVVTDERPNGQRYSVTQLMIFREDPQRYYRHFYLSDLPPDFTEEFADEPGGQLWGSLVHHLLEYFFFRTPQDDEKKIDQLLVQFPPEPRELNRFRAKLIKIMRTFRESEFVRQIDKQAAYSEFAVSLRMGPFILQGIFDLLYKNERGDWEVVDYKSNRIKASDVTSFARKYEFQIRTYALLLAALYPQQKNYPVSLFFLEPQKIVRREYSLLEIESSRSEINKLLNELFQYEKSIFSP